MSREREAFHRIRDNARNSVRYTQVHSVPKVTKIKTNYLSAVVWTSVVATVVCSIFMGLLLYVVNESRIEERLEEAASHALYNLESVVKQQNIEIQQMKEENKKIYNYLQLWTPLDTQRLRQRYEDRRKPPSDDDLFNLGPDIIIDGRALPPYRKLNHGEKICLPFLE